MLFEVSDDINIFIKDIVIRKKKKKKKKRKQTVIQSYMEGWMEDR